LRMFGRKSKVIEDVREEKQQYRRCERGKVKLPRMFGRKTKSQRMFERKSKAAEDLREEKKSYKDDRYEKQCHRGCSGGKSK